MGLLVLSTDILTLASMIVTKLFILGEQLLMTVLLTRQLPLFDSFGHLSKFN